VLEFYRKTEREKTVEIKIEMNIKSKLNGVKIVVKRDLENVKRVCFS